MQAASGGKFRAGQHRFSVNFAKGPLLLIRALHPGKLVKGIRDRGRLFFQGGFPGRLAVFPFLRKKITGRYRGGFGASTKRGAGPLRGSGGTGTGWIAERSWSFNFGSGQGGDSTPKTGDLRDISAGAEFRQSEKTNQQMYRDGAPSLDSRRVCGGTPFPTTSSFLRREKKIGGTLNGRVVGLARP